MPDGADEQAILEILMKSYHGISTRIAVLKVGKLIFIRELPT